MFTSETVAACCDCVLFQSEVEDTLKRIQAHKGVQGLIIVNSEGNAYIIRCTTMLHFHLFFSA